MHPAETKILETVMRGLGAHVPLPFILHVVYVVLRCKRSLLLLSVSSLCMLLIDARLFRIISVLLRQERLSLALLCLHRLSFLPSLPRGERRQEEERLSPKKCKDILSAVLIC